MAKGRPLRLRPLGIMDVLDETIELYRSNFWLLVGITAIVQIPTVLLNPMQNLSSMLTKTDTRGIIELIGAVVLWFLLFAVVAIPLMTGVLTGAISERYLSRQTTIIDSYKRILRSGTFARLIWANVIIAGLLTAYYSLVGGIILAILFGMGAFSGSQPSPPAEVIGVILIVLLIMAAIVPLVWFAIATTLTPAAVVVESLRPWQAVKRSLALTKGMIWSIIAASLILGIAVAILQSLLVAPFQAIIMLPQMMKGAGASPTGVPFWFSLVNAIVAAILGPLTYIVYVLFYYDARVRKEGFDLIMLAEQLDSGGHPGLSFGESVHPQERDESWRTTELIQPPNDEAFTPVDLPADEPDEPVEPPKDEPV